MSAKDAHLYNTKKAKLKGREIVTSSGIGFASQLSSLIASSKTKDDTKTASRPGRSRPQKEDFFSAHNKGVKKRALKDIDDVDLSQKHSTSSQAVDDATWHRAKRKMEEKARLYAAMKRGDVEDEDGKYGVDFDRKWAEAQERGEGDDIVSPGEESEEDISTVPESELVEYLDEFGRLIKGTRAQAAREEMRKQKSYHDHQTHDDRLTARPNMPTNVIYGDTVQVNAFNPDEPIAQKMEELAAKRDKELTPPPDEHFDARKEIRSKGVGFFQFSADEDERKRQMVDLEKERMETEKMRSEAKERKEARKKELEERRRALAEKRSQAQADQFLDGLMDKMQQGKGGADD